MYNNTNIKVMKVIKRNGNLEELSFDKVLYRIRKLTNDKNLGVLLNIDPDVISQKVIKNIYNNVKTSELDEEAARIAISLSTEHPEYADLASRIIISNMHKNTTECFSEAMEVLFNNKVEGDLHIPLISEETINIIRDNKEKLNFAIDYNRDYLFDYFGFKTLERSYLLKIFLEETKTYKIIERPQHMWLRVSLGIHKNNIDLAIQTYTLMSTLYFTHASPTLFNSATPRPQLSSCFLIDCDDSMLGIYKCISDCAIISKNAGGIGVHISNIRSKGSYIRGTNGRSDGIVKMLKVFNETARFANQGSKRNGSFAVYLETFHEDIYEFLELRKNSGDETLRARDLFYALWVNDAFMEAVENDKEWYLMSEDTSPNLTDVYGDQFKELYYKYVKEKKYRKVVKARDLWQKILVSQIETGMPYMSYKDHVNKKSNQKNIGTIKSSNLCVAPETKILTSKGHKEISSLENQEIEVWNGEEFSKTIVRKTGENQELLKVTFSNGSVLECTPYHKFHIQINNETQVIQAKDLIYDMKLINSKFPVIKEGEDKYEFPYLHGWISKDVPINFNLNIKLLWLEGFLDKNTDKNSNSLININVLITNKNLFDNVRYLLTTLGCNPGISQTPLYYKINLNPHDISLLIELGFSPKILKLNTSLKAHKAQDVRVVEVVNTGRISDTYCFTETKRNLGIFNGVIAGNCNEITLVSNEEETAVCNICTFSLPKYLEKNEKGDFIYNHQKLYDVVKIATKNMNNVIDYNYYPTTKTKASNLRNRPIAMGIQGLANLLFQMKLPFECDEAKNLNKEIMETIQYAGWTASMELAKNSGVTYSKFKGSPISEGLFQHNLWGINDNQLSGRWDWEELRQNIKKYGVLNSMITALPPTASTSQILGNYESFEPQNSNIFMRSTLSGDFPIINKYLVSDLLDLGLWNSNMKERIISNNGSVQNILEIPLKIKQIYKTIWEIPQKHLIDMSADRALFVDQSQSLNLFMDKPTIAKLSSMHFYAWKSGLKTGMYYFRTKAASTAQKFTVKRTIQEEQKDLVCSIDNRDACVSCSG